MDMLKKENKIVLILLCFLFLFRCSETSQLSNLILKKSIAVIGSNNYYKIYNSALDSLTLWNKNDLDYYWTRYNQVYMLDSLLCFNQKGDRFISSIHRFKNEENPSDELLFLLGEKINDHWYFFGNGSVTLPRKFYTQSQKHPLSQQQAHKIALKEIYEGYLLPNGEINEAWFANYFEGPGWGDFNHQEYDDWCFNGARYKTPKEYYQACHLCKVKSNWARRDTTQPLIQLNENKTP
jgi:hypothetical protein